MVYNNLKTSQYVNDRLFAFSIIVVRFEESQYHRRLHEWKIRRRLHRVGKSPKSNHSGYKYAGYYNRSWDKE